MKLTKWTKRAVIAGVAVMLVSGCSALKSQESQEIDPPRSTAGIGEDGAAPVSAQAQQSGIQVTMYMKDKFGYVAPVTVHIPKTEAVARTTLEYMVEDGPGKQLVPDGFEGLLPKGTAIRGLDINKEKKLATVDFSKEFAQYAAADERKVLEAVTWALTGFPGVDEVRVWVEGRELKEMPVARLPIDGTLNRSLGINLERAEDADYGQTTPVTLYFLSQTENGPSYYVPVTRMIKRTDDRATATVEQLIAGPMRSNLYSVMASTVDVPKVAATDGVITVNFTDTLLGPDQKAPAEALQSIVLSLTETAGDAKVQIKVNNVSKVDSTDNTSYSQPVSRPSGVNSLKL